MKIQHYQIGLVACLLLLHQVSFATPRQILDVQRELFADSFETLDVGEQQVLLITSLSRIPISRGVALLVSESGTSPVSIASLAPLTHRLNELGWVTLQMAVPEIGLAPPSSGEATQGKEILEAQQQTPAEPLEPYQQASTLDPENFARHQQLLVASMQAVTEQSRQYPGFLLVIAQGTSAAWLTKIYAEQQLTPPDALVVISPFWPTRQYNLALATSLANTSMPVLDIYQTNDNSWSLQSAKGRSTAALKALKLHYRQRQVGAWADPEQNAILINKEIYGWLHYLGW